MLITQFDNSEGNNGSENFKVVIKTALSNLKFTFLTIAYRSNGKKNTYDKTPAPKIAAARTIAIKQSYTGAYNTKYYLA